MMATQQYVTLVAQGGTPVRLANQYGAPYPTTGYGALVFNQSPSIYNPVLYNPSFVDFSFGIRTSVVSYYVSNSGSDGNPGTAEEPVLTTQKALDLCAAYAGASQGPFNIIYAPNDTYLIPATLTYNWYVFVNSPVTFVGATTGGRPNVILSGSPTGTRDHNFISLTHGVRFSWQDVKFQSFASAVSSAQNSGVYFLGVVDAVNCGRVVSLGLQGLADCAAGDWDGRDLTGSVISDGQGMLALQQSSFDLTQVQVGDLVVHHVDRAFVLADGVAGHFTRVMVTDCNIGLDLTRGSGSPNQSEMVIMRCTEGVHEDTQVPPNISNNFNFGQNTAGTSTASTISGTTLTVGGTVTGIFAVGQTISGSGIPASVTIKRRGTGSGGVGTYTISTSLTIATPQAINSVFQGVTSTASTISGTTLVFGGTITGTPLPRQKITGTGIPDKTHLVSLIGPNTWTIDASLTLGPIAINTNNGCDDDLVLTYSPTTAIETIFSENPRPVFNYTQDIGGTITGTTEERTLYNPFSILAAAPRQGDFMNFDIIGNCNGLAGTATLRFYVGAVGAGNLMGSFVLPIGTAFWSIGRGIVSTSKTDIYGRLEIGYGSSGVTATGSPAIVQINTGTGAGKVSLTADTPIIFTVQLSNAADSIIRLRATTYWTYARIAAA